jgi:23S rRNA (adenine1618-N6)-methyltransferase
MVTPGGETAFVSRIIDESLQLRERVQWYTSMLGKLSSVPIIIGKLKEAGVSNWAVAEFAQGSRTRRWGVGWSFVGRRPGVRTARAVGAGSGVEKRLLPFPGEFVVEVGDGREGLDSVGKRVDIILSEQPLRWMWKGAITTGVGFAPGNVWSRAARRKQIRSPPKQEAKEEDDDDEEEEEKMGFGFKITVKVGENSPQEEQGSVKGVQIVIRWLKGFESAIFESFCGMIKRKLEE